MPAATLVSFALPSIFARMTSCRGPSCPFHTPMISIGTGSGSVPVKTVQAVACIPGLMSLRWKISTLPALGGLRSAACAKTPQKSAANTIRWVMANLWVMEGYYLYFFVKLHLCRRLLITLTGDRLYLGFSKTGALHDCRAAGRF